MRLRRRIHALLLHHAPRCILTDSVQIADPVVHRLHPCPVLPGVGQGIGRSVGAYLGTERGHECRAHSWPLVAGELLERHIREVIGDPEIVTPLTRSRRDPLRLGSCAHTCGYSGDRVRLRAAHRLGERSSRVGAADSQHVALHDGDATGEAVDFVVATSVSTMATTVGTRWSAGLITMIPGCVPGG